MKGEVRWTVSSKRHLSVCGRPCPAAASWATASGRWSPPVSAPRRWHREAPLTPLARGSGAIRTGRQGESAFLRSRYGGGPTARPAERIREKGRYVDRHEVVL